jgi:hypothetical protein
VPRALLPVLVNDLRLASSLLSSDIAAVIQKHATQARMVLHVCCCPLGLNVDQRDLRSLRKSARILTSCLLFVPLTSCSVDCRPLRLLVALPPPP